MTRSLFELFWIANMRHTIIQKAITQLKLVRYRFQQDLRIKFANGFTYPVEPDYMLSQMETLSVAVAEATVKQLQHL